MRPNVGGGRCAPPAGAAQQSLERPGGAGDTTVGAGQGARWNDLALAPGPQRTAPRPPPARQDESARNRHLALDVYCRVISPALARPTTRRKIRHRDDTEVDGERVDDLWVLLFRLDGIAL